MSLVTSSSTQLLQNAIKPIKDLGFCPLWDFEPSIVPRRPRYGIRSPESLFHFAFNPYGACHFWLDVSRGYWLFCDTRLMVFLFQFKNSGLNNYINFMPISFMTRKTSNLAHSQTTSIPNDLFGRYAVKPRSPFADKERA